MLQCQQPFLLLMYQIHFHPQLDPLKQLWLFQFLPLSVDIYSRIYDYSPCWLVLTISQSRFLLCNLQFLTMSLV
jgi:hypothetical protein